MTAWVIDRVGDGAWRLLVEDRFFRMGSEWLATADGSLPAVIPFRKPTWDAVDDELQQLLRDGSGGQSADLMQISLHDDGMIEAEPTTLALLGSALAVTFPRLPAAVSAAWEARPPDAGPWPFEVTRAAPAEGGGTIITTTTRHDFDPARHLVTAAASTGTARGEPALLHRRRTKLVGSESVDVAWLAQAKTEAQAYSAVLDQVLALEQSSAGAAQPAAVRLREALANARRTVTLPLFAEHLADLAKMVDQLTAHQATTIRRRAALLGTLAPAWTLPDLDCRARSLAEQRGKVVVLDFWYRGCGPCQEAMPRFKQVAAHFAGSPVAVFGRNSDPDPTDARVVADAKQLNYPNLRTDGTNLADAYGATTFGFPTLVVVDAEGIIRAVEIGLADELAATLIRTVDGLLHQP